MLENNKEEQEKKPDIFDRIMHLPGLRVFEPLYKKYKDKIAFAYEDGTIEVGSLSEAFNKVGNNEIEKMYKIVSNI